MFLNSLSLSNFMCNMGVLCRTEVRIELICAAWCLACVSMQYVSAIKHNVPWELLARPSMLLWCNSHAALPLMLSLCPPCCLWFTCPSGSTELPLLSQSFSNSSSCWPLNSFTPFYSIIVISHILIFVAFSAFYTISFLDTVKLWIINTVSLQNSFIIAPQNLSWSFFLKFLEYMFCFSIYNLGS